MAETRMKKVVLSHQAGVRIPVALPFLNSPIKNDLLFLTCILYIYSSHIH